MRAVRPVLASAATLAALLVGPAVQAACERAPAPIRDIAVDGYYADRAGSEVDADKLEDNRAAVRPLEEFGRRVVDLANAYHAKGRAEAASCAGSWLAAWADGGALLGTMSSRQAEYTRKWMLAELALAYLQLKPGVAAPERARIEPWLVRIADASIAFADASKTRNNHVWWVALAAGATARATGDERLWAWAHKTYAEALATITADGVLPEEARRAARTLHYHAFASGPLVVLAELASGHGEDWWSERDGALHRLVRRTLEDVARPEVADQRYGIRQERPKPGAQPLAWVPVYERRFPDRVAGLVPPGPFRAPRLGGDVARVDFARLGR